MKKNLLILLLVGMLFAPAVGCSPCEIKPNEVGVLVSPMGTYMGVQTPGFFWKPWFHDIETSTTSFQVYSPEGGDETVTDYNNLSKSFSVKYSAEQAQNNLDTILFGMPTDEELKGMTVALLNGEQTVYLSSYVVWRVNPDRFLQLKKIVRDRDPKEMLLKKIVSEGIREAIAKRSSDDLIMDREGLEVETLEIIQRKLNTLTVGMKQSPEESDEDYRDLIKVSEVKYVRFCFSREVEYMFAKKALLKQQKVLAALRVVETHYKTLLRLVGTNAQSAAKIVVDNAAMKCEISIANARSKNTANVLQATAAVAEAYKNALTDDVLKYKVLRVWDGNFPEEVVVTDDTLAEVKNLIGTLSK